MTNIIAVFMAIIIVEGGPSHRPGETGRSNITQPVIIDFNRANHAHMRIEDMADHQWEQMVAVWTLRRYASRITQETGKQATVKEVAACWRAGWRGHLRGKGAKYGQVVDKLTKEN